MMEWSLPWPSQDEGILVAIVTFVIKSLSTAAGPFEVMDAVTNLGEFPWTHCVEPRCKVPRKDQMRVTGKHCPRT
jgi:hypothetical protein